MSRSRNVCACRVAVRADFFRTRRTGWRLGDILHSGDKSDSKPPTEPAKVQTKDRDMGAALRTVYQRTIDEAIPAEMLDLLGKLD